MLGAVPFGPQQNFGLELVHRVPVAQDKCDCAISLPRRQVYTQFPSSRQD